MTSHWLGLGEVAVLHRGPVEGCPVCDRPGNRVESRESEGNRPQTLPEDTETA